MPFTPWHRSAVWDAIATRTIRSGPSLRTSRSGFRLTDDPLSKGGAEASSLRQKLAVLRARTRHTRLESRPAGTPNITKLLGKLSRNVSDHENIPVFSG